MKHKQQAGYMLMEQMLAMVLWSAMILAGTLATALLVQQTIYDGNALNYKKHQRAVQIYMSRFYGNMIQNTTIGGVLTPAFQSPMCDPSGRNNAHITAYYNGSLNREDGRRACLIPPTAGNTCNNNEPGCFFVYPACNAAITNRPCVTDHLRSYPLNPSIEDLLAMELYEDGFPTQFASPATLITAIYKNGVGPDGYNLQAMIALDVPITKGNGDIDQVQIGELITRIGPDGGTTRQEFGSGESLIPMFYAEAGQNTGASNAQMYVLGGMDYATASPTLGYDAPAKLMIQSSRAGLEADKAAGRNLWPGLVGYPQGGVLVVRAGFGSATMDQYARLDGTKPFTGDVNLGGNKIGNLAQVEIDKACDNTDPSSAASKAMNGQVASVSPKAADPNKPSEKLGSAYLVVCGYDAQTQGYIWKKSTAGVNTIEDAQAGMFEGNETNYAWACFRQVGDALPGGGTVPATAATQGGINTVKFVMKNGAAWAYIQKNFGDYTEGWIQVGGPYPLNQVYDWNYFPWMILDRDPTKGPQDVYGFQCRFTVGWYANVGGRWYPSSRTATASMPDCITAGCRHWGTNPYDPLVFIYAQWRFGPDSIQLLAQGQISRANMVPYDPTKPNNSTGDPWVPWSANHVPDDLSQIPVTATGSTTDQALTGCSTTQVQVVDVNGVVKNVVANVNCTSSNLAVNTAGQTTPRPANIGLAYNPSTNAAPIRSYGQGSADTTPTFKFQSKSNCNRVGGLANGAIIAWGLPPATWCAW